MNIEKEERNKSERRLYFLVKRIMKAVGAWNLSRKPLDWILALVKICTGRARSFGLCILGARALV
jgi:hypothetical protein